MENEMKEYFVSEIMQNFPEYSQTIVCTKWDYENCIYTFVDTEEDAKKYVLTKDKLVETTSLLFTSKWSKGLTQIPENLFSLTKEKVDDLLCQLDADDLDAFIQLAIFEEIIYG